MSTTATVIVTKDQSFYSGIAQKTKDGYKIYTEDGPKIIKRADIEQVDNSSEASQEEIDRFEASKNKKASLLKMDYDQTLSLNIETFSGEKFKGIAKDLGAKVAIVTPKGVVKVDKFSIKNSELNQASKEDLANYSKYNEAVVFSQKQSARAMDIKLVHSAHEAGNTSIKKVQITLDDKTSSDFLDISVAKTDYYFDETKGGIVRITSAKDHRTGKAVEKFNGTLVSLKPLDDSDHSEVLKESPASIFKKLEQANNNFEESKFSTSLFNDGTAEEGNFEFSLVPGKRPDSFKAKDHGKTLYFTIVEGKAKDNDKAPNTRKLIGKTLAVHISSTGTSLDSEILKEEKRNKEATVIITKDGEIHSGIVANKLEDGYVLDTETHRITINNNDIEQITHGLEASDEEISMARGVPSKSRLKVIKAIAKLKENESATVNKVHVMPDDGDYSDFLDVEVVRTPYSFDDYLGGIVRIKSAKDSKTGKTINKYNGLAVHVHSAPTSPDLEEASNVSKFERLKKANNDFQETKFRTAFFNPEIGEREVFEFNMFTSKTPDLSGDLGNKYLYFDIIDAKGIPTEYTKAADASKFKGKTLQVSISPEGIFKSNFVGDSRDLRSNTDATVIVTKNGDIYSGIAEKTKDGYKIFAKGGPKLIKSANIEQVTSGIEASDEEIRLHKLYENKFANEPYQSVVIQTWKGQTYRGIAQDSGGTVRIYTKNPQDPKKGYIDINKSDIKSYTTAKANQSEISKVPYFKPKEGMTDLDSSAPGKSNLTKETREVLREKALGTAGHRGIIEGNFIAHHETTEILGKFQHEAITLESGETFMWITSGPKDFRHKIYKVTGSDRTKDINLVTDKEVKAAVKHKLKLKISQDALSYIESRIQSGATGYLSEKVTINGKKTKALDLELENMPSTKNIKILSGDGTEHPILLSDPASAQGTPVDNPIILKVKSAKIAYTDQDSNDGLVGKSVRVYVDKKTGKIAVELVEDK